MNANNSNNSAQDRKDFRTRKESSLNRFLKIKLSPQLKILANYLTFFPVRIDTMEERGIYFMTLGIIEEL